MNGLLDKLREYADSDYLPMHMPGHKRRMGDIGNPFFADISKIDITEIDGFDNLHHASGILLDAERRAAALYGSGETHYLVNGSTAGILSAISGCTDFGGKILMSRNSHKAAYHAVMLKGLYTEYLYPQIIREMGINGPVSPADVENTLEHHPDIQAVFITSPTYDGVVSDIEEIARIVHRYGIPLIVDEAHGAHFPFSPYFPKDSVSCGADAVIHSLHKTLPALTQSALIHLNGEYIDRESIRRYLTIYQSSSPSYVLMAGMDACMEWVSGHRKEFDKFAGRLEGLRNELENMRHLRLLTHEMLSESFSSSCFGTARLDKSKILVSVQGTGISGHNLDRRLREEFHIEMEMACGSYVCAITSAADTQEILDRFGKAFLQIDESLNNARKIRFDDNAAEDTVLHAESVCTIQQAEHFPAESCTLENCEGRISKDFVTLYPPGIPILAPGERVSREIAERIDKYLKDGLEVHGAENGQIRVSVLERKI